jgi:hypothetical protein
MNDKIQEHIDSLLKDAPRNRRFVDLREELLSGCLDKYADLTASGMSPEDAYNAVVSGIGDVDELIGNAKKAVPDIKLLGPLSSSLWSLITLVYLSMGFLLGLWHPGWMVFLFGSLLQLLLKASFVKPGMRKGHLTGALYVAATIAFLGFGFATNHWTFAVLIFVLAVAVEQIVRLAIAWRDTR